MVSLTIICLVSSLEPLGQILKTSSKKELIAFKPFKSPLDVNNSDSSVKSLSISFTSASRNAERWWFKMACALVCTAASIRQKLVLVNSYKKVTYKKHYITRVLLNAFFCRLYAFKVGLSETQRKKA